MRKFLITASALGLIAGVAQAQIPSFSQLDNNGDGQLNKQEFTAAFGQTPVLSIWDSNKDQTVDASEFHNGIFNFWDENDDNQLSEQEVKDGIAVWLDPKPAPASFAAFDADDNGSVSSQELGLGMPQDAGLFRAWDQNADGQLAAQEIHAGLFEVWDTNNDNAVSQAEYEAQRTKNEWIN